MNNTVPDSEFDYGADSGAVAAPKIGGNLMAQLKSLADKYEIVSAEIARLEAALEVETTKLRELTDKTIPGLMDGMNGTFKLDDGRTLEVVEKIRASIAKEKAAPAVAWLDEHDFGSIVKRQFVIQFNRDDEAWAKKFEADLRKRKKPLNVVRKHTVHPQTLEAFVREKLGEGVDLPIPIFGIYRQRIASVESPDIPKKPRKSKKSQDDDPDF